MEGASGNEYLYNGKELWEEADLNWYDYGFRNYDPQIGRFPQLDPLTFEYPELTNYQYASCEPVANVDRDGLEAVEITSMPMAFCYGVNKSLKTLEAINDLMPLVACAIPAITNAYVYQTDRNDPHGFAQFLNTADLGKSPEINGQTYYRQDYMDYARHRFDDYVSNLAAHQPRLEQWAPNWKQRWSQSSGLLGRMSYGLVNDFWVTAQNLGIKQVSGNTYASNLGWYDEVRGDKNMEAFAGTALTFVPAGGVEARAAEKLSVALGRESLVREGVNVGTTVLGHVKDNYIKFAAENGYSYFEVSEGLYCQPANQLFLDEVILRGDKVILSRAFNSIRSNSILEWEVEYLSERGYRLVNQTTLIPR